ncbi:hypothetical protein [Sneathiella chinensis]|uniref:Transcriptional regulator n=1 Tax=Sneathiella chinensis TaxID=349750 RepID=A0ABQ5U8J0_9PROT|nr:hypothetical protein [Sneathiella chinensis]GLQ07510.1 hypothetical protein GCM10007924_27310 [Sneathiella chinensis]
MTRRLLTAAKARMQAEKRVNLHGITQGAVLRQLGREGPSEGETGIPACVRYLWAWFGLILEFSSGFAEGVPGPSDIRSDLVALTGLQPAPQEVQVLSRLIRLWRQVQENEDINSGPVAVSGGGHHGNGSGGYHGGV